MKIIISLMIYITLSLHAYANTFNIILSADMNNSHSILAKIFSEFLVKHLPDKSKIAFRIVPGAGGVNAANYLYEIAPKDGNTIGILYKAVPLIGVLNKGDSNIRFDATKFNWLGSLVDGRNDAGLILSNAPYYDNMTIGSDNSLANPVDFIIRNTNLKFKKISGYKSPEEVKLAVLKNEVNAIASSILGIAVYDPNWKSKFHAILQFGNGRKRHSELLDVPTVAEITLTKEAEKALSIVENQFALIRSYVAPPGIPEDKIKMLQNAFNKTSTDKEFIEKAKAIGITIDPIFSKEAHEIVNQTYNASPELLNMVR